MLSGEYRLTRGSAVRGRSDNRLHLPVPRDVANLAIKGTLQIEIDLRIKCPYSELKPKNVHGVKKRSRTFREGKVDAADGIVKSQTSNSPSSPPEANMFGLKVLNSNP